MINWIDIIIVVILALGFIDGFRKGFISSVSNLVCTILSIIAAKMFFMQFAKLLIECTPLKERIMDFVHESKVVDKIFETNIPMLKMMGMSDSFSGDIKTFATFLIINAIAFLGVFIVARVIFGIVEMLLEGVFDQPGLKEINALLGSVLSLGKVALIMMIVLSIVQPVITIFNKPWITEAVNNSLLVELANKYNFVLGWIWSTVISVVK